jgi:hypothetical protein
MNGLSHQKIITEYCKCKNNKNLVENHFFSGDRVVPLGDHFFHG